MNRQLIFAGALAAVALAVPANAQVTIEMSEITCKQFAEYDADTQDFVANWMRGYFSSKNNITVIDSRYVRRNTDKITHYCKKKPNSSLMEAIQKNAR
ncbi:MAG: HdeA/HdeB family chaperone [Methylocystis sp.]|uniref:HdeA/HdeB family chaperone n=1 Tax=Methylocystis sp. TaxID=1911079 RepID=UPI003DA291F6